MPRTRSKIERSPNYGFYADVCACCLPLLALACYQYGLRPALLALAALTTAYVGDCLVAPLHGAGYRSHEPSSGCFALLIVMMMPATVRYSVVVVAVLAAVLAKEVFGGEGHYPFHPAAVGMVVAGVAWPEGVFHFPTPGTQLPLWDTSGVVLSASMNATLKSGGLPTASTQDLLVGNVAGPLGTTAVLVLCACGLFLLARGRLPLSAIVPYFAVCVILPWLWPQLNELPVFSFPWEHVLTRIYLEKYMVLGGAMIFGGVFLLCEPVTMPNRTSSRVIYGLLLGVITVVFRYYSSYETGICFAVLLMNAFPEWLDRVARRIERTRFMRREEQRVAKRTNRA